MRVIIDTNIFITREDYHVIQPELQELLKLLNELKCQVLIHPLSVEEISKDKDEKRKEIALSKIGAYPKLENPPSLGEDTKFASVFDGITKLRDKHELIDYNLIYSIYKDAVDFLITEDRGIHKKAIKIGITDRVFDISTALEYFKDLTLPSRVTLISPPALKELPVHNLDVNDPFFDSIKLEYGEVEFTNWWKRISKEGRKAWVYFHNNKIGAILIYKIEDEEIPSTPPLSKKRRLKICTLKVGYNGYKIGELFVKLAVKYAIKCEINELYLTHFTKEKDYLVNLIEEFGFHYATKKGKEDVFIKKLIPDRICESPLEVIKDFYPSFYDGNKVKKFVAPIQPEYHTRLFTDYPKRQLSLSEFAGGLIIEGNTITKAYLCYSKIKTIMKGDILLFYRSIDEQRLTSVGVVEDIFNDVTDSNDILKLVGKRSVYTKEEIEMMAKKPTKVILFRLHFHFPNTLELNDLIKNKILAGVPQSIQEVSHANYEKIKEKSGINKIFTIRELKE